MDFKAFQEKALTFALYSDASYPFVGLAGEVGEFLDMPSKMLRGDDVTKYFPSIEAAEKHQLKEAGDVLWMLSACLNEMGLTLQDAADACIEKLTNRATNGTLQGTGDNR